MIKLTFLLVVVGFLQLACSSHPTGQSKVELIDRLVAEQEFDRIQHLLADIDTREPEFESLVIRRRAIRPLIVQFEQRTVSRVNYLQTQDLWPQALDLLRSAENKLSDSDVIAVAKDNFYIKRAERLDQIHQQIGLLKGESQLDKTPLVEKIVEVHPSGFRSRWYSFQHKRKNNALAGELAECGHKALSKQELELAEACFSMVRALSSKFDVNKQLAEIEQIRVQQRDQAETLARLELEQRLREKDQKVVELRQQYQSLHAANWLSAAKQTLAELRVLQPNDPELKTWAEELKLVIDQKVQQSINQGQALYSHGKLEEALETWESAAELDPENLLLKGHIARAERFLNKLQRLNKG